MNRKQRRSKRRDKAMLALLAGCATLALTTAPALAAVTATGEVFPTDPLLWRGGTFAYIGRHGVGSLTVEGGSGITSSRGYLGEFAGSQGMVTVDGPGSTWTNGGLLYVGYRGHGTLSVLSGAEVIGGSISVGLYQGSTGSVIVDGPGSTLTSREGNALNVGFQGDGTLSLLNGAELITSTSFIARRVNSTGMVTVDGPGSMWTNARDLTVGSEADGALWITNGGTVSVGWATYIAREAGSSGVIVFDGGTLNTSSLLAASAELTGTGTINTNGIVRDLDLIFDSTQGLQRSFTINDNVAVNLNVDGSGAIGVGFAGSAVMTIADGRVVSSSDGYLGYRAGSVGTATVQGPNSAWLKSNELYVGREGEGVLSISSGGTVASHWGYVASESGSTGLVEVEGTGSSWSVDTNLSIGRAGFGTLSIANGGEVSNGLGRIAESAQSTGNVVVDGDGSVWTNLGTLLVGERGEGTLIITNGGQVASSRGIIGDLAGSTGSVTVEGVGSTWTMTQTSGATSAGALTVGSSGSGTLSILGGGIVTNVDGWIGSNDANATGSVVVHGPDSTWTTRDMFVGGSGSGMLSIHDGGAVNSRHVTIGRGSGSTGTVTVDGVGSVWTSTGDLTLGRYGSATLSISNGGLVSVAGETHVAERAGSAGQVVFDNGTLTTRVLWVNPTDYSGTGTINANGLVSDLNLVFDVDRGAQHGFTLIDNVTLNVDFDGSGRLGIGYRGSGAMSIADGVSIGSTEGYVGYESGSSGMVIVDGSGSTWANSGRLDVGREGDGTMSIVDGGVVSSAEGRIAAQSKTSTSTVSVTGPGSMWLLEGSLIVGRSGDGTLMISNGGTVSSGGGGIGDSFGSTGKVTVDGPDSTWTNTGNLDLGGVAPFFSSSLGGDGELTISNGGTVSSREGRIGNARQSTGTVTVDGAGSTWTNSHDLRIGLAGIGTLSITNGGTVVNPGGRIASTFGVTSIVTVDGPGSTWINSQFLTVGSQGDGILVISSGGVVSSEGGTVAGGSNATGTVTVDGAGSMWTNSGDLTIGWSGAGVLSILSGGTVSAAGETYVARNPGSSGTIDFGQGTLTTAGLWSVPAALTGMGTIDAKGIVSDVNLAFDSLQGPQQSFIINEYVTVNLQPDGSGSLGVGYRASGTLATSEGVAIGSTVGYLGYETGSSGAATIDGPGSAWIISGHLWVGRAGDGTLTITDGGSVSNTTGRIADLSGSTGKVTVDGPDSTWANSGDLWVGRAGDGTLTITDGGTVSNAVARIAEQDGTKGVVTVDGPGSTWTNSGDLHLGAHTSWMSGGPGGDGTMTISNGGAVSNRYGMIAAMSRSTGAVTVEGANSTWINSEGLDVGRGGHGTMSILDGGLVSSAGGRIAALGSVSAGTVVVSGPGSTWLNHGDLTVGRSDEGTLTIANGGRVSNMSGRLGELFRGRGMVTVDGVGSTWTNSGDLYVGDQGNGTLTIVDGGTVSSLAGYVGDYPGETSTVVVDGLGSTWTLGGMLQMGRLGGEGELFIHDGGAVANTEARLGIASGSRGTVEVDGTGSTWTNSGRIFVGMSGEASLSITAGGMVSNTLGFVGNGTGSLGVVNVDGYGSMWLNSNDLYIGRDGDGILTITNRGLVQVDGRLLIDPFGRGGTDYIAMDTGGMLKLLGDGAADIDAFLWLGLFVGSNDIRYWDGVAWDNILNATPGIHYTLSFDGTHTTLTVPEPASLSLLALGGMALLGRRR
ncbi:MAG: PEP-CTERM sorting domain-containing protein [Phycisphaeraceae bacterium]|nr:PEP-CTERM sorting domain-containing protein [Phycisphaeraceae bacterium]